MIDKMELASLLKKEREAIGLTLKEVAEKMGFPNYQTLSNIESGQREIKAWELANLSRLYSRDISYFFSSEQEKSETMILWRNPGKGERQEEVKRDFVGYCEKYRSLLRILGEREVENRGLFLQMGKNDLNASWSFENVTEKAAAYSRLLELGSRPACSLAQILEEKVGIKVIYLGLPEGISGGSANSDFGMAILVNSNDVPKRRNFDLAHEFFHLLTWGIYPIEQIYKKGKNRVEQLADVFASAFLMPEDEIRREVEKRTAAGKITYMNLIEIANAFEVSLEALLWRLVNLRMLDKKVVQRELASGDLKKEERAARNAGAQERKPHLSPRYISLAIKAFQLGKISKAKFAEYVGISFSEIPEFLNKQGFKEGRDYSVEYRIA